MLTSIRHPRHMTEAALAGSHIATTPFKVLQQMVSGPTTESLPNPFRPGNGVPPPHLAGRDNVLGAFEDWLLETPALQANWTLTGLRGTGRTVLLAEFAARVERGGWLTLHRELGDRHRDDVRFAEAIVEDAEVLIGRADASAAVGQALERSARWLRQKRSALAR